MKIKKGFVLEPVADSYLACATGALAKKFGALVRLNSSGAFLWKKIEEENLSLEELADALALEYGISPELAAKDALAFVEKLRDNGILDE